MLSYDGKWVEPPPPYDQIILPNWFHHYKSREKTEELFINYIKTNNLGIYADRLFLVRQKSPKLFVVSIYRYIPNEIKHHLLQNYDSYFLLDNSIAINQTNIINVIEVLKTDIDIGYRATGEIISLCNNYINHH